MMLVVMLTVACLAGLVAADARGRGSPAWIFWTTLGVIELVMTYFVFCK